MPPRRCLLAQLRDRRQDAHTSMTQWGVRRVTRRASALPLAFRHWEAGHLQDVLEMALGTVVLLLPEQPRDVGWAPVVFDDPTREGHAAFGWIHPGVLVAHEAQQEAVVTVGHARHRGQRAPSHPIAPGCPGLWIDPAGGLLLDARWHWRLGSATPLCTGYCQSLLDGICAWPAVVSIILRFLAEARSGLVVCDHGKHRSVACAVLMATIGRRNVDWTFAARRQHCPCNQPATVELVASALRGLPRMRHPSLLARALGVV